MARQLVETKRIVIVDDEPDFLRLMREYLVPAYDLVSLMNGEGILEELESLDPDLLILDVRLPGPDGFALCRSIRKIPRFALLPILFLTSSSVDADFIRGLDSGGSSYMTKPVSRRRLLARIAELTGG